MMLKLGSINSKLDLLGGRNFSKILERSFKGTINRLNNPQPSQRSFASRQMCTMSSKAGQFNNVHKVHSNSDNIFKLKNLNRYKYYSTFKDNNSNDDNDSRSSDNASAIIESGREFDEVKQQVNLSQFTSNYWRSLRVTKPLLLSFNVDKSAESRMMDAVMGSGVFCKNLNSLDALFETILQYKESKDLIGCYMNLDNNYDNFLNINKDLFEKIKLSVNSVFLDVTYPYQQSVDEYMKISKIITLVNPNVVRFCSGTLKFLLNTDLDCPLLKENSTNEDFSLERCYYLSEKYDSTVIDSSDKIVISNHNNMEIVVFPKLPQILNKIHGYNNCYGSIIASMITLCNEDYLVPSSAAISGLDYVSNESIKKSNGPGSILYNFIDILYNLSMSPDNILKYKMNVKFYKRK